MAAAAVAPRMNPPEAYYIRIRTAADHLEPVLLEIVAPLLRDLDTHPHLESAYFARYRTEALLFVLGEKDFLEGWVRPRVEGEAEAFRERGAVESWVYPEYVPEIDRYGGEEGMRLAGRIFQADSRACLSTMDGDRRGLLAKSRREWSLVLTERLLDLLQFDSVRRTSFYRYSYDWAIEQGIWQRDEFRLLEERYQGLKDGLLNLLRGCATTDPATYGGEEPARVARDWIEDTRPFTDRLLRAHADGLVRQDLVHLAWSYAHMHCIRLGITGNAEAVLRYLMHRLYEDGFGRDA